MTQIPLLSGAYEGVSLDASAQEAINYYFEPPIPRENTQGAHIPVHGCTEFADVGTGAILGSLFNPDDSMLYVVTETNLYEVTEAGVVTDMGAIVVEYSALTMSLNVFSKQILITGGANSYIFNYSTDTLTEIVDADFPSNVTTGAFIDGYFIVNDTTTAGRWRWSNINDGLTWSALDFATVESIESVIQAIHVDRGRIFFWGDTRGEIWYNSGEDVPFKRFEYLDSGAIGAKTVQKFDNTTVWLARNKRGHLQAVMAGTNYQPVVISTPQLSRKWQTYTDLVTSDGALISTYAYQIDGHEFYVITFPEANKTFAYDALTKEWHQRSGPFAAGVPSREAVNTYSFCTFWQMATEEGFGLHIVGSSATDGKLFVLRRNIYTWNAVAMERRITGPTISIDNLARLRFSEVQVDISATTGTATLSWSTDSGSTFNSGRTLTLTAARSMLRKLGAARSWTFRFYTATTGKPVVLGLFGRTYNEPFSGASKA